MGVGRAAALKPAVFFDRDGVLNDAVVRDGHPYPPAEVNALRIDPDARAIIEDLTQRGFAVVVVTNQPDVARGTVTRAAVDAINSRLRDVLPVDDLLTCFHDTPDGCACRKPAAGMLLDAARRHRLDLSASYMVGDRWSDIQAGRAAGCRTVWIDRGYSERAPADHDQRVRSLTEAHTWIVDDYSNR
jgi:D-glycero-D-manno-heptose 1,7-bisphosphate phosphatase